MIRRAFAISSVMVFSFVGLAAGPAAAKDGDVKVSATCSGSSTAKLKLGPRPSDNSTEIEFEVDQNRNGETWRVVIKDNGVRVLRTRAVTRAPSGSFEINRDLRGGADHRIVARATNLRTGERCRVRASV